MATIRPANDPAVSAVNAAESRNATLKVNSARARRMTDSEALAWLDRNRFIRGDVIRHTVHRKTNGETIVTDYHRASTYSDGSPRYDRARLTVTYAI